MSGEAQSPLFTEEVMRSFSDVDYAIYQAVIDCGSILPLLQVRDVADKAHVSAASVVRFCKKCGCKGFPDFKQRFVGELGQDGPELHLDSASILGSFLQHTKEPEFQASMQMAFETLRMARLVLFTGIGISGHLAAAGARCFCNVGCFAITLSDAFMPLTTVPAEGSVAVVLSFSGNTPETVAMASDLATRGIKIVSITNSVESTLARMSHVAITYDVPDAPISGHLNLGTQVPTLYVIEELAQMLYAEDSSYARDTYR